MLVCRKDVSRMQIMTITSRYPTTLHLGAAVGAP